MARIQLNQDYTSNISLILGNPGTRGCLYLGDQKAASNLQVIKKYSINCVITVAQQLSNKYPMGVRHKKISICDSPCENILDNFQSTYTFIKKGLAQGNILIHCRMGMSRSAALVIAFLIRKYKISYQKALEKVKEKRNIVKPNSGFVEQLRFFEKKIIQDNQNNHRIK